MGSFDEMAKGCDAIVHIASPFILNVKDAKRDLLDPAVIGTSNVLEAANKSGSVKKVVLTSSVVAIYGDNIDMKDQNLSVLTEDQYNTSSSLKHQPYAYSKVEAEKKAWEMAGQQTDWELIVLNPSFVMGPSLTSTSQSESLKFMTELLSGKQKSGTAELYMAYVDVRDLYGDKYKLPKSYLPKWLLSLIGGLFGLSPKFVKNNVGIPLVLDATKSKDKVKLTYIPLEQTAKDMVDQMND